MTQDLATVLVSAVVATVNPSLLAAVTVMLLLPHPKRLMLGYLQHRILGSAPHESRSLSAWC